MNYWTTCLCNLHGVCEVLFFVILVFLLLVPFMLLIATSEDKQVIEKFIKSWKKVIITWLAVSFLGIIFMPSRNDMKYYYAIDKLIEYIEKTDIMLVSR